MTESERLCKQLAFLRAMETHDGVQFFTWRCLPLRKSTVRDLALTTSRVGAVLAVVVVERRRAPVFTALLCGRVREIFQQLLVR
jgi:hypothetical protein